MRSKGSEMPSRPRPLQQTRRLRDSTENVPLSRDGITLVYRYLVFRLRSSQPYSASPFRQMKTYGQSSTPLSFISSHPYAIRGSNSCRGPRRYGHSSPVEIPSGTQSKRCSYHPRCPWMSSTTSGSTRKSLRPGSFRQLVQRAAGGEN